MRLIRSRALFAVYPWLPHRLLGRVVGAVAEARRPRVVVDAWTGAWMRRADVDLDGTERGPFASIADAFGRRLVAGGRRLDEGIVSPVDGEVMSVGCIERGTEIVVKGLSMSLARIVGSGRDDAALARLVGGAYVVLFLSPRGYHHVHAPAKLRVKRTRWIPGRYFPQNHDALRAIPRVYERNERVTIEAATPEGHALSMVMVAASLVGGIELFGRRADRAPIAADVDVERGERLGSFSLGSTVVLLLSPALATTLRVHEGQTLRMGQTLGAAATPIAVGTRGPS